ncbi:MAG: tricarballylate dehydrogenase, partial [Tardiphaga sp.]|nr:tricarballylate dehydrogenase [Tardiphaga sp.]
EYRIRQVTKVQADTLEELSRKLDDVDPAGFMATVTAYNAAVTTEVPFNPNVKDGRTTRGLLVPKSNWANTLDQPPYLAFAVTCGITFTFGGIKITPAGEVVNVDETPIPNLYAAGELVGGLFYFNYPGGTGLMAGSVFGRLAGDSAGANISAARTS